MKLPLTYVVVTVDGISKGYPTCPMLLTAGKADVWQMFMPELSYVGQVDLNVNVTVQLPEVMAVANG